MEFEKSIKQLIIDSEKIIDIIESDVESIRLSRFARILNIKMSDVWKLFEKENIIIRRNPNTKISTELLKQLILREAEISFPISSVNKIIEPNSFKGELPYSKTDNANDEKLKQLSEKIENIDAKPYSKSVILNQFARNEYIREYAKIRANGFCELCEAPAPFQDIYGKPFLETHHVVFLSKGGEDSIDNVVALCPNCHRKIHNLNLEEDVKKLKVKLRMNQRITD